VGIEKQKLNNIMKQNRITTVQDIGSSPHSGKLLVVGSTGNAEEQFKVLLAEYKKEYFRVHEKEDDSDWVYKGGYIRNTKNKFGTPYRIANFEKWLENIKARLSKADQILFDKKNRYADLGAEINELSKEIERKSAYREELRQELGL
jgi:hypothetical protein